MPLAPRCLSLQLDDFLKRFPRPFLVFFSFLSTFFVYALCVSFNEENFHCIWNGFICSSISLHFFYPRHPTWAVEWEKGSRFFFLFPANKIYINIYIHKYTVDHDCRTETRNSVAVFGAELSRWETNHFYIRSELFSIYSISLYIHRVLIGI